MANLEPHCRLSASVAILAHSVNPAKWPHSSMTTVLVFVNHAIINQSIAITQRLRRTRRIVSMNVCRGWNQSVLTLIACPQLICKLKGSEVPKALSSLLCSFVSSLQSSGL